MDTPPSTLYKYLGPDRIDVLQGKLIRYSPFGAFNDPFEGRPDVTSLNSEKGMRETFTTLLPEEARSAYNCLLPETKALLSYETWTQLLSLRLKEKEPELLQMMHGLTPLIRNLMAEKFDELIGALCLSEVPDSLLMWSHYAASHSGFVLAFDAQHPHFHEQKGPDDEFRHLRRVMYREARPSATLVEFEGVDVFLVKSGHWSYEREWRILRALGEAQKIVPGDPFSVHLFRFPPAALQAVILGARASSRTVNALLSVLRGDKELSHVRLRRATPDSSHFLLRICNETI